jgi:uncharacterized membrane protein YozB (DUF420 family)
MFSQPALNAALNATSAVLLAGGYAAIKAGKMLVHKRFMVSAFCVSVVFLVSYVIYHIRVKQVVLFHAAALAYHLGNCDCADDPGYAAPRLDGEI